MGEEYLAGIVSHLSALLEDESSTSPTIISAPQPSTSHLLSSSKAAHSKPASSASTILRNAPPDSALSQIASLVSNAPLPPAFPPQSPDRFARMLPIATFLKSAGFIQEAQRVAEGVKAAAPLLCREDAAQLLETLASLSFEKHNLESALRYISMSLAVQETISRLHLAADIIGAMGHWLIASNLYCEIIAATRLDPTEWSKMLDMAFLGSRLAHSDPTEWSKNLDIALLFSSLAIANDKLGDPGAASMLQCISIEELIDIYGDKHPVTSKAILYLANFLRAENNFEAAEFVYKKVIGDMTDLYGTSHPLIATAFCELSTLYFRQGEPGKAVKCMKVGITMKIQICGRENHLIAECLSQFGDLLVTLWQSEVALPIIMKGLEICNNGGNNQTQFGSTRKALELLLSQAKLQVKTTHAEESMQECRERGQCTFSVSGAECLYQAW